MFLSQRANRLSVQNIRQTNYRWPEPTVDIRNFSSHQAAHQNLVAVARSTCCFEDRTAFLVSPPTAPNSLASDSFSDVWHGPLGAFQDHTVLLDKSDRIDTHKTCFQRLVVGASISNFRAPGPLK